MSSVYRPPVISELNKKKTPLPWIDQPERSADKYEKHNQPPPEKKG